MSKPLPQILFVHGGMTFRKRSDYLDFLKNRPISLEDKRYWATWLKKKLIKQTEFIYPRMPQQDDARYEDWQIHFERYLPHLKNGVILIGSSLGGIFLAKYLAENKFPKKIKSVYLVCPPFDNSLPSEDLVGGFKLPADLSLLEKNCPSLNLLFSSDDDVVPLSQAAKYAKKLPGAKIMVLDKMGGHFKVSEFPQILKLLKEDIK